MGRSGQFSTFKAPTGPGEVSERRSGGRERRGRLGNASSGNGVLLQTLGVTLQPNTTYTLVFSVGSRPMLFLPDTASNCSPVPRLWRRIRHCRRLLGRLSRAGLSIPQHRQSGVARAGTRNPLTGSGRGQANFDKISLDATPTIISSSVSQIASGGRLEDDPDARKPLLQRRTPSA